MKRLLSLTFLMLAMVPGRNDLQAQDAIVDFQRDVQPILSEHCTVCHGADPDARQSGLRLDLADGARRGGDSGTPAIVAGQPDESELIRRITSSDGDMVMPPPAHKKPLSDFQKDMLRKWVLQGAQYEEHWAFVPPVKRELPPVGIRNPIDALVAVKLQSRGLDLSEPAPDSVLCRRLYLDLIGLPPAPEQLADFEQRGLAATVESLLSSERFGEKWARHWLDAARYSDTNGYEKDLQREQWVWRDWVINALNQDMPYDRFILEQIAGDLLPETTQSQIIATGFLRNSMINEEGAIIPEQFRMVEMFDRMDCVGKAVLGLTIQCAQCHTHKFDPITHDEYYGLFAFLNNASEAQSWVYTPEQLQQLADLRGRIRSIEDRIRADRPHWQQELTAWSDQLITARVAWEPLKAIELGSISGLNHPTQEADKSLLMKGHSSADVFIIATPNLNGVTGLQLEALNHRDLPHNGPGRSQLGTWAFSELEAFAKKPDGDSWEKLSLMNATADFSEPEVRQPDGKKVSGPVAHLIDGTDDTTWNADRGIGRRNQPSVAVVQFAEPLSFPEGTQFKIAMRTTDMLGCCRLSITRAPAPTAPPVDHGAILALLTPAEQRSPDQQAAVFTGWRMSVPELKGPNDEIAGLVKSFPVAGTSVLHLAERRPSEHRLTHLLDRGNWEQPMAAVEPHVPAAFHSFPSDAPRNRLGFARWLTDTKSPLTARVAVNRVWQSVFGIGLVETSEDFGTRAAVPEYRELLDWLAVDFMEHGWSQKHLLRTICTSAVYQQTAQASLELQVLDPQNHLLARGPRFRADSEIVRDIALSVSGLIHHRLGGPAVIPPVPQNVLDYNFVYPTYWKPAEGPERYRRSLYGFRKRSMPDPVMSNFDAPNADSACSRRVRSNTPLAALTGLNEPVFVESARALALRILRDAPPDDASRCDYAFLLCTARHATDDERGELLNLLHSRRQRIAEGWLNPREITTGDPALLPPLTDGTTPQDAAAWTLVARVMLNLDETVSKN